MSEEILNIVYDKIRAASKQKNLELNRETKLGELALDSLKLIEIVFGLETELDNPVDEDALATVETVGDIASLFASVEYA